MFYDHLRTRNLLFTGTTALLLLASGCFTPPPPPPAEPAKIKEAREMAQAADLLKTPYARSMEIYRRYAATGNSEAQYQLGIASFQGRGTAKDLPKAVEYFSLAAKKDHPQALYELGFCCFRGEGREKDEALALKYWQRAAKSFPDALMPLALLYSNKQSKHYLPAEAEKSFRAAIDSNVQYAKWYYARFLHDSNRYSEAAELLAQLTAEPEAQYLYALYLINGYGIPADTAKGTDLLLKHCSKYGDKTSNAELIFCMAMENIWFDTNKARGIELLRIAADMGLTIAQYRYALELKQHNEPLEALKYARLAAQQGSSQATLMCGILLKEQKNFREAYKYFTSALQYADTKKDALERLSHLLHYYMNRDQEALHWDAIGFDYESVFCQNELAKHLASRKDDNSFARAAALYAHAAFALKNKFAENEYKKLINAHYDRLRQLADNGNNDALFAVALSGFLEKNNSEMITELLRESAKKGHVLSNYILGNFYYNSKQPRQDHPKSLEYFLCAARAGHQRSTFRAIELLFKLHGINAPAKLMQELSALAVKNDCHDAIVFYAEIQQLKGNNSEAVKFYRITADNGSAYACFQLYKLLKQQNKDEALQYLLQAINMCHPAALLELGDLQKAQNNARLTFGNYLLAIIYGDKDEAFARIAECCLNGFGCTRSLQNFWRVAEFADKQGSGAICHLLGKVFREGKIVPADQAKARHYFELGAKRGNQMCRQELKKLQK